VAGKERITICRHRYSNRADLFETIRQRRNELGGHVLNDNYGSVEIGWQSGNDFRERSRPTGRCSDDDNFSGSPYWQARLLRSRWRLRFHFAPATSESHHGGGVERT